MDYSKIIELDNVDLQNCVSLYVLDGLCAIINDGRIINFEKEHRDYGQSCKV